MKKTFVDPFTVNLPYIDLHGLDRDIARVMILDFINDNCKMSNNDFYIIHGNGSGILRKTVIDTVKNDKRILKYELGNPNIGCTRIWLNKNNVNKKY